MQNIEFNYLVLKTFADWQTGKGQNIRLNPDGSLSLWPELQPFALENAAQADPGGTIDQIVGLAVDHSGNLFVIDAVNCSIHHYRFDPQSLERIHCIGDCGHLAGQFDFTFNRPPYHAGGLALDHKTLYVADSGNHRIQAFYRFNYQIRFILGQSSSAEQPSSGNMPGEFNFPTQVVVDSHGHLYVLDYGNQRILKFDQQTRFLKRLVPQQNPSMQPIHMAVDQKDILYVLYAGYPRIIRFDKDGHQLDSLADFKKIRREILGRPDEELSLSAIAVDRNYFVYLGEIGAASDRMLMIHILDQSGNYLGSFGEYRTGCTQLVVDRDGNLYANCGTNGTVIAFRDNGRIAAQGLYYSKVFDSTEKDNRWHRLVMSADIPEKTKIEVFYRTSNNKEDLKDISSGDSADTWSRLIVSPQDSLPSKDGLFLNGTGQYLRLKIQIFGDEKHSPVLRQIKLYYPRLSYLRYLPATYMEDSIGREFLERFLSVFESLSFDMEQNIVRLARYFDPHSVEASFLNWLGSWLAVSWDENWSENKKRTFIAHAYELYKSRGTLQGLKAMVEFFTDRKAAIVEHFRLRSPMILGTADHSSIGLTTVVAKRVPQRLVVSENSKIGEFALQDNISPPETPFEANAFNFTILIDTSGLKGKDQVEALQRLILADKPAHTRSFIRVGKDAMRLDMNSLVQIDTVLQTGFAPMRLGIESRLGKSTFLGTRHCMQGVIGLRSKISIDAVLH
jgi:phage tail-like protein